MNNYICECCNGHIDPRTMTCEYCGTQYKREHDDSVIRIETYKNPIQILKASASITDRMLREEPQKASEYAIRAMASRFAEIIAPYMVVQTSYDPVYQQQTFHAMLKVVVPKEGAKNWIEEGFHE